MLCLPLVMIFQMISGDPYLHMYDCMTLVQNKKTYQDTTLCIHRKYKMFPERKLSRKINIKYKWMQSPWKHVAIVMWLENV